MHQHVDEPFVRVGERRQAVPDQCATFTTSYLGHRIHFNGSSPPSRPFSSREGWKGARYAVVVVALAYSLSLSLSSFIPLPAPPLLSLPLSISSFSARSSLTFNRSSVISGCYFFVQRFLARTIYPRDTTATGNTILDILRFPCYRHERIKPLG